MIDSANFERQRARKNVRTALMLGALALTSLVGFFVKVLQLQ